MFKMLINKIFGGEKKSSLVIKENNKSPKKNIEISKTKNIIPKFDNQLINLFDDIHPDLQNLIWIKNGPKQNFFENKEGEKNKIIDNEIFSISSFSLNSIEPSLIDLTLPIEKIINVENIENPNYYPSYTELNLRQRALYLEFLKNPYDNRFNIGYVFLLYYGLERHLSKGNLDKPFEVILKLRKFHKNKSFLNYSSEALILSCLNYQRADLVAFFMETLTEKDKTEIPIDLLLLYKYNFNIGLTAKEVMNNSKAFNFNNVNYIKKYPDHFENQLKEEIMKKNSISTINIAGLILENDGEIFPLLDRRIFANLSISDKVIKTPSLLNYSNIQNIIYDLLENAHNNLKVKLVQLRKNNLIKKEEKKKKIEIIKMLDTRVEKELLADLKASKNNPIDRHFAYLALHEFYYSYRNIDEKNIRKCIDYCIMDINFLKELTSYSIKKKIESYLTWENNVDKNKLNEIKKEGFIGRIVAFKRLAIIYEKSKEFQKAIEICNASINYGEPNDGTSGGFEGRIKKLEKKLNK